MELGLEVLPVRRRGRPCRYNPAYCDRVLVLAAEGCGKAEIAAGLGVSVKTLNAWMTAFNDFREAMSEAKELEYAWWLKVGRQNQFKRSWNASAWALQMRNRFRKRFGDRSPAKDETPEESVNAEQLRAEMERKLSRIADAQREESVSCDPDAAGTHKPPL
jgi:DNA-directed RNA polymerase specialized sigma24 family protein